MATTMVMATMADGGDDGRRRSSCWVNCKVVIARWRAASAPSSSSTGAHAAVYKCARDCKSRRGHERITFYTHTHRHRGVCVVFGALSFRFLGRPGGGGRSDSGPGKRTLLHIYGSALGESLRVCVCVRVSVCVDLYWLRVSVRVRVCVCWRKLVKLCNARTPIDCDPRARLSFPTQLIIGGAQRWRKTPTMPTSTRRRLKFRSLWDN